MFPIEKARTQSGPVPLTESFIDSQIEAISKNQGHINLITFNVSDFSFDPTLAESYRTEGYSVVNMGSYVSLSW